MQCLNLWLDMSIDGKSLTPTNFQQKNGVYHPIKATKLPKRAETTKTIPIPPVLRNICFLEVFVTLKRRIQQQANPLAIQYTFMMRKRV